MTRSRLLERRGAWIGPTALLAIVATTAGGLAAWKHAAIREAAAGSAAQPEPAETVTAAVARAHEHRPTTTSIGTVLALRSISLRNEVPGTVERVMLEPGQVVEAGTLLVALDVSVEEAELKAYRAQAVLAETVLDRVQRARRNEAVAEIEVDRARAELDVALAQIARIEAIIARKTILAPFRARVGISDVHPGQYLLEGTLLTTLQGVGGAAHVDFAVAQQVAAGLAEAEAVEVFAAGDTDPIEAVIVAIDARVDPATRNATVRARIEAGAGAPAPGASVRVRVPAGPPRAGVVIPVSALRQGPEGDHVFVIGPDDAGRLRARARPVRAGAVLGDEVVIEEGLSAGEQVAASGSFKLRENVLVSVAGDPAASG